MRHGTMALVLAVVWAAVLGAPAGAKAAVSAPDTLSGPAAAAVGDEVSFNASGAHCSEAGHSVVYQFDWGDGSEPSAWLAEEEPAPHTYGSAGLYQVTATACCQVDQELSEPSSPVEIEVFEPADESLSAPAQSSWSAAYWVALEFSIDPPMRPEGPSYGAAGLSYAYTAWGAVADCGDAPEYQFDWGDGTTSGWCDGQASHAFASGGTYDICARARCPVHGITSAYSTPLQVVMDDAEVITPPSAPTGPADPRAGVPLCFLASGAVSSRGHPLEYQFHWGDGSPDSEWFAAGDPTHVFEAPGTYTVKARARCQLHPEIISSWSPGLTCEVRILETISPPDFPSGPDCATVDEAVAFSVGGAISDLGHELQYQLDWGDGTQSPWGGTSASHAYSAPGSYAVRARARCYVHDYIISHWSGPHELVVGALPPEKITVPYFPDGPSSGAGGETLEFSTGGAASNLGHPVEYQFDWGDATSYSPWSASATAQHAYAAPGTFLIRARARCSMDADAVSAWSGAKAVLISGGTYPVTWSKAGQGSVKREPEKEAYEQGEVITLTATAAQGWRFHHWEGDAAGWANPLQLVVTGPMHVIAIFGQGTYLLRVECAGPGSVQVCPQKLAYAAGDWVQLVACPGEGCAFSGWSGDLAGTQNPILLTMNSDMALVAGFAPMECTLEVAVYPEGGGTVSIDPDKDTYDWGETVELSAAPAAGYEFHHWGGDILSTASPVSVTINGHTKVKAIFAATTAEHFPRPEPQQAWVDLTGGISICGLPAAPGDEIAVLDPDGTLCGQFTIVDPEGGYGLIRVWGDDPATLEDEGASPGDPLTFLLWDSLQQVEVPLEAVLTGSPDPVVWTTQGDLLPVELATVCQEAIPLTTGWNLISFRTNRCYFGSAQPPAVPLLEGTLPVAASISEALASIDGQCQAVRSFDAAGAHSYDSNLPAVINDLCYLAPGYGYWIKVSQPCTLILAGGRVLPSAPATLGPSWNLVGCWANEVCYVGQPPGVPFATPPAPAMVQVAEVQDLMPGIIGTYDVMRSFDGAGAHTYDPTLPAFLSDLPYVGPGYGYWLKMRQAAELSY
jgi:hypothetical protein